jgi:bifunctional non-homologous end joining protein LigD
MARTARRGSSLVPEWTKPMLAKPDGGQLRSGPQWTYEYKLDFCARFEPVGVLLLQGDHPACR